jgi:hypothetical protein
MRRRGKVSKRLIVIASVLFALLLAALVATNFNRFSSAYSPKQGDYFTYSETIIVNNGQGSYTGYTDQTNVNGTEQVNAANNGVASASYTYSYQYSNNQGSQTSNKTSGSYSWSFKNYTYVSGTDNQVGYSKPTYVWFAMNASLPAGGTFYILNTHFTVLQRNYSFQLPTEGKYVQTIQAEGTGQYQRNDSYGVFSASYTWYAYFDPATGYIVGYNYVEQDSGQYQGQQGSFTYTDDLYVTSTSYSLAAASPPPNASAVFQSTYGVSISGFTPFLLFLAAGIIIVLVVVVVAIAFSRKRRESSLPQHPYPSNVPPPVPPPSTPWQSTVDMGSKPPEQVVIRDVAKVNCRFCGTLIPSTADHCPYCGAPRQ